MLTLANTTLNGASAALGAGEITLSAATVQTGGALALNTGGQFNAQGATLAAGTDLTVTAAGLAATGNRMTAAGNASLSTTVAGLTLNGGTVSAGDRATLTASSNLTLRTVTVSANTLIARANASILLDGATLNLGERALIQSPGVIDAGATSTVTNRRGDRIPVVIFDSRSPGGQNDRGRASGSQPIENAVADLPGVAADQQATQVSTTARVGTLPDPRTGEATQPGVISVRLALRAGNAAVFLLLDADNATGTIDAGRLGVSGSGCRVDLTGTLGNLSGNAAAARGASSRLNATGGPLLADVVNRFRLNNCVLGSVNCTVLTSFQPLPNPFAQLVVIELARPSRDPDAILPNVIEEDY